MQNTSYAVCNESVKKTKVVYPLEKQLRVLANLQGIYVVAVFDCCRAAVTKAMKEQDTVYDEKRGLNDADVQVEIEDENNYNLVLTFGCPPEGGVD